MYVLINHSVKYQQATAPGTIAEQSTIIIPACRLRDISGKSNIEKCWKISIESMDSIPNKTARPINLFFKVNPNAQPKIAKRGCIQRFRPLSRRADILYKIACRKAVGANEGQYSFTEIPGYSKTHRNNSC